MARVLVVDDSRDLTDMLALLLSLWGHQPVVAHDGRSALTAAQAHRPDVVLLDLGLPGMNGYEVARHLRQQEGEERAVLVALTGRDEDACETCQERYFDHRYLKPMEPLVLQELLARSDREGASAQPAP